MLKNASGISIATDKRIWKQTELSRGSLYTFTAWNFFRIYKLDLKKIQFLKLTKQEIIIMILKSWNKIYGYEKASDGLITIIVNDY